MEKLAADLDEPTLHEKIISSANWGMLAGFWVELPLVCSFLAHAQLNKAALDWGKMSEWTTKLVLPATLAGVAYGWNQPNREEAKLHKKIERIERKIARQDMPPQTSWVAAEDQRAAAAQAARIGK